MAKTIFKSKHAFGAEEDLQAALDGGKIDEFDVFFLTNGKIGWINKEGKIVYASTNARDIKFVEELPATGVENTLYMLQGIGYVWNGTEYQPIADTGISQEQLDDAVQEAKDYTDDSLTVIEF